MNNLYDDHPLLAERGIFWRCDHGWTGFREGFVCRSDEIGYVCAPAGKA